MHQKQANVTGTLNADGTLTLDGKPDLPPGPVRVCITVLLQSVSTPHESLVEFVRRARRELEQAGAHFMNEQEVNAHIAWLRGDHDDLAPAEGRTEPGTP